MLNGMFSKFRYFRNDRIPAEFVMVSFFNIKQWFRRKIKKMIIILSMSIQTVIKSPEKTSKETL